MEWSINRFPVVPFIQIYGAAGHHSKINEHELKNLLATAYPGRITRVGLQLPTLERKDTFRLKEQLPSISCSCADAIFSCNWTRPEVTLCR